jgi:hypothetical protein
MTDGDVLLRHARDVRRESVAALLRALASWERLAFVDFSQNRDLAAELEGYGIACVEPQVLHEFFGLGSAPVKERRPPEPGKLRFWAATLALAPRPVDRRDAHALRRELGLDVSPWALRELVPAGAFGVHVDLEGRQAKELQWLRRADEDGTVEERALGFWDRRLAEEDRRRRARGGSARLEPASDLPSEPFVERGESGQLFGGFLGIAPELQQGPLHLEIAPAGPLLPDLETSRRRFSGT